MKQIIDLIPKTIEVYEQLLPNHKNQTYKEDTIVWGWNGIWEYEQWSAIKSIYIDNNLHNARNHFYNCGRIDQILINLGNNTIGWNSSHLSYILLSDSFELINWFKNLDSSIFKNPEGNIILAVYYLLNNDFVNIRPIIKEFSNAKRSKSKDNHFNEMIDRYFQGLISKDLDLVEFSISELLDPKKRESNDNAPILGKLMPALEIGLIKISWLQNLKLDSVAKFIPQEIFESNPNQNYKFAYDDLPKR